MEDKSLSQKQDKIKFYEDSKFQYMLISGIIIAIISHGMALFNKYSFHDDPYGFNTLGSTFNFGRWTLGIMDITTTLIGGSKHYSIPLVEGTITLICLIICAFLISKRMKIESKWLNILLCGMFVSFPSITGIFGYMYTAPHYYIGALLGVVGAYIYTGNKNVKTAIICSVLMACSVGTYQANIPICMTALLLFMLEEVYEENNTHMFFLKKGINNVVICLAFLIEYLVLNKFFIWLFKTRLPGYRNLNTFGRTSLKGYVYRTIKAYKEFINPDSWSEASVYQFNAKYFYIALLVVMLLVCARFLVQQGLPKALQIMVLMVMIPLSAHFIYVMVDETMIYVIMVYGIVFVYALFIWILDKVNDLGKIADRLKRVAVILIGIILYFNIRYDNICYLKAEILQSQGISYFTELISAIRNVDGYKDDMPVVYINELEKADYSIRGTSRFFDYITASPYNSGDTVINEYSWKEMMELWCGYAPDLGDEAIFEGNEEVADMTCFPNDGSIKVIDGYVVVKFAE